MALNLIDSKPLKYGPRYDVKTIKKENRYELEVITKNTVFEFHCKDSLEIIDKINNIVNVNITLELYETKALEFYGIINRFQNYSITRDINNSIISFNKFKHAMQFRRWLESLLLIKKLEGN